jgi:hypothetical protein
MYIQGELFVYIYSYRQINMPTLKHSAKYMEDFFNAELSPAERDLHRSLCNN